MRIFWLLLVFAVVGVRDARACDCGIAPTNDTLLEESALIFVGRVISVAKPAAPRDLVRVAQVQVLAAWRGVDAGDVISVRTEASDCGFRLLPGATHLFFTNASRVTNQCAHDQDVRNATASELAWLGKPVSEVSDQVLASCPCQSTIGRAKKPTDDITMRANAPAKDGRYMLTFPIELHRPARVRNVPMPSTIVSPAGGCAFVPPNKPFWYDRTVLGDAAYANSCVMDQLRVKQ